MNKKPAAPPRNPSPPKGENSPPLSMITYNMALPKYELEAIYNSIIDSRNREIEGEVPDWSKIKQLYLRIRQRQRRPLLLQLRKRFITEYGPDNDLIEKVFGQFNKINYVPLRDEPSEGDSDFSASVDGQAPKIKKISPFVVGKINLMVKDPFGNETPDITPLSGFSKATWMPRQKRGTLRDYCSSVTPIHEGKQPFRHRNTIDNIDSNENHGVSLSRSGCYPSVRKILELATAAPISDSSPVPSTRQHKKKTPRTGKIRVNGIRAVMEAAGVLIRDTSQKNICNTSAISTPRNGNTPGNGSLKNSIMEGSFYASNRSISKNTKSRFAT
jgi:hypothetical protein